MKRKKGKEKNGKDKKTKNRKEKLDPEQTNQLSYHGIRVYESLWARLAENFCPPDLLALAPLPFPGDSYCRRPSGSQLRDFR